jgi:hypothetical protein
MYIATLVDEIVKVLSKLESLHGTEFSFAMLYSGSESIDYGWNLIVAAPWIDEDLSESRLSIAYALHDDLGSEGQTAIARITTLKTTDPFVRDAKFYSGQVGFSNPKPLQNVSFDGVPVVNGVILRSSPN